MKSKPSKIGTTGPAKPWHVILPPLENYKAPDIRNGRMERAIVRNNAIWECAQAIEKAGGTYSHAERFQTLIQPDGLRVESRLE